MDDWPEAIRKLEEAAFQDVVQETSQQEPEDATEWAQHLDNVIDLLSSLRLSPASLVAFRSLEALRMLIWVQHAVLHGAYHAAIRELRYALEAMVQARALDHQFPGEPMAQKWDRLQAESSFRFSTVLAASSLDDAAKDAVRRLYRDLSAYVHPTRDELEAVLSRGRVESRLTFSYDVELFRECLLLSRRTTDALLHLALAQEREARDRFRGTPLVMESLRKLDQRLTLRQLGSEVQNARGEGKIVVLGWGSLVWNPKQLQVEGSWQRDGPVLPLEFSRISGDGRLTLVIDPQDGTKLPVLYARSAASRLDAARENLRLREETTIGNIGYVDVETGTSHGRHLDLTALIGAWVQQRGFAAAVWTDLPPTFENKKATPFSLQSGLEHLASLDVEVRAKAWEYIARAPAQIETAFRALLRQPPEGG